MFDDFPVGGKALDIADKSEGVEGVDVDAVLRELDA